MTQSVFKKLFNYFSNLWNPTVTPATTGTPVTAPPFNPTDVSGAKTQSDLIYYIALISLPLISILSFIYFMHTVINSNPSYMMLIISIVFGITFGIMYLLKP